MINEKLLYNIYSNSDVGTSTGISRKGLLDNLFQVPWVSRKAVIVGLIERTVHLNFLKTDKTHIISQQVLGGCVFITLVSNARFFPPAQDYDVNMVQLLRC